MFAAVYGHGFRPDPTATNDAFSRFHTRAVAMGWESGGGLAADGAPGLWGMNDAGWTHPRAPRDSPAPLAAWFQVDAEPVADTRPLPVQPFLRCAADAIGSAGTIDLQAVQLLLPLHRLDRPASIANAPLPSMKSVYWFSDAGPGQRTPIRIILHAGGDSSIAKLSAQIAHRVRHLDQELFRFRSYEPAGLEPIPAPLFDDDFWNRRPVDGVTIHGDLAVWSFDAIGWLCEFLADALSSIGIRSALLVTVAAPTP